MQTKRLKLRNGVLAELSEALRFSIMDVNATQSDTLVNSIESNISVMMKFASNMCHRCNKFCNKCVDYYMSGLVDNAPFQLCDKCSESESKLKHRIHGDYDCCFLYRAVPVILLEKRTSVDIVRFFKRMLLADATHQEFLVYIMSRYLAFIGDYPQIASTLLKYSFSSSSSSDLGSVSTRYIQLVRVFISIYESVSSHKELTRTDYKSFAEALNYAEQSHSSLIHSVYLHCLLQIDFNTALPQAITLLNKHSQSFYLYSFVLTFIRYIHNNHISTSLSIKTIVQDLIPKYILLNPTSQITLFDVKSFYEIGFLDTLSYCSSLFTIIEYLFSNPPLQLYAMHLLCTAIEDNSLQNTEPIKTCIDSNQWWISYLDDSDLRIEYAKAILCIDTEEHEIDENVVTYYDNLYETNRNSYDYSLLTFWQ